MTYRDNPETRRIAQRDWYLRNRELKKAKSREYRIKNREIILPKLRKYHISYYEKNKDRRSMQNKILYRNNHEERRKQIDEYERKRIKEDLNFAIRKRLRIRLRNIIKIKDRNYRENKYGIDFSAIIEHLKPFPNEIEKYHIDHIKPLCSFDLTDQQQIREAFAPENHQWLLAKDNIIKGGKVKWQEKAILSQ